MNIAFLILAHQQIELVYKQIELLDDPEHFFFIHLDKNYNPIIEPGVRAKSNVCFFSERIHVNWGGFSIVQATLLLLQNAVNHNVNFDYFILLSGQCLPIQSKATIRSFFEQNNGKCFIELKSFSEPDMASSWYKLHYPVFFDALGRLPNTLPFFKKLEYKKWLFKIMRNALKLVGYKRQIPDGLQPAFGSQWWALHRDAVHHVLDSIQNRPHVLSFFRYTWAPDELFFQSVLNSYNFTGELENRSLWYIDWSTNGPPKTMTRDDYNKMMSSRKLFARKFDISIDTQLIQLIEKSITPSTV